jgi:hypothetical protein
VVFQVTRAWAGVSSRRMSLYLDDTDCAFVFEAGHRYVVFAKPGTRGRATTTECMRTSEADRAQDVLKALGAPHPVRRTHHP